MSQSSENQIHFEQRSSVPSEYTWDLSSSCSDDTEWEQLFKAIEAAIPKLEKLTGSLGQSADKLFLAISLYLDTERTVQRLAVYAGLHASVDMTNSELQKKKAQSDSLSAKFSAATSFMTPELLLIEPATLEKYLKTTALLPYSRYIQDVVRYRPHTLDAEQEKLLSLGSEVTNSFLGIFSQLTNADFNFGEIKVEGQMHKITHSSLITYLKHSDREVRKAAHTQYYKQFEAHKNMLAATYAASVRKDVYLTKARKYPSSLERGLFGDNVGTSIYDTLTKVVRKNLGSLHSYNALRSRLLKLDKIAPYDLQIPLVSGVEVNHSFDQAVDALVTAAAPLGDAYVKELKEGLTTKRWVDRYENKAKRSGAFSAGCYDSEPFILMNYRPEDVGHVFTLMHEAGHSMHSLYSRREQSYQDHSYTIFVAEVASTFNEELLMSYFMKKFKDDPRSRAYILNHYIDNLRGTFFKQTLYAEFERKIHTMTEQGDPPSLDDLTQTYGGLLEAYNGDSYELDPYAALGGLRVPHFYFSFYVYKYATGIASAIALAKPVMKGDTKALDKYLSFLKAGCTKYPVELLQDAGVDLSSAAPLEATCTRFSELVIQLEAALEEL